MPSAIVSDRDILGGEPVFRGTRVPVNLLRDCLEAGESLDYFLQQYPTVPRELAVAAIDEAWDSLLARLG